MMIFWGEDGGGFKELIKKIQQVLQSSQNREQFEGFVNELEMIVKVRLHSDSYYEICDDSITCRLVLN